MSKETFLHLSIGFLLGVLITILITQHAISNRNSQALKVLGISEQSITNEDGFEEDDLPDDSPIEGELEEF